MRSIIKTGMRVALLAGASLVWLAVLAPMVGAEDRREPLRFSGAPLSPAELSATRARGLVVNEALNRAELSGNTASNVVTGNNTISGSFGNSAGIVNVFQNTGNNSLFQSSTVVNVTLH